VKKSYYLFKKIEEEFSQKMKDPTFNKKWSERIEQNKNCNDLDEKKI